jgi:hypothetical protein
MLLVKQKDQSDTNINTPDGFDQENKNEGGRFQLAVRNGKRPNLLP